MAVGYLVDQLYRLFPAFDSRRSAVQNRSVTPIEGLSPDSVHPVQKAWLAENVPQYGCGVLSGRCEKNIGCISQRLAHILQ
jgi:hypothetical protein